MYFHLDTKIKGFGIVVTVAVRVAVPVYLSGRPREPAKRRRSSCAGLVVRAKPVPLPPAPHFPAEMLGPPRNPWRYRTGEIHFNKKKRLIEFAGDSDTGLTEDVGDFSDAEARGVVFE